MVKVLANGDIVPDDDPRVGGGSSVSRTPATNRPRQVIIAIKIWKCLYTGLALCQYTPFGYTQG